ncbi:MAG TPA: class F sortase [Candidatus Saccharimonadales bacterium]|nr:class F sortase [Candidatus Saccharimonadales bacterium]
MKKFFSIVFLLFCILSGVVIGSSLHKPPQTKQVISAVAVESTVTTSAVFTPDLPKSIAIPAIHLSALIEQVGLDSQQRMDVPKEAMNAGWYSLGFRPGANGNAVLDGHLDTVTGAPAVFWNVKKLKSGDEIAIMDENNRTYTFVVTKQIAYPYNNVPLQDIFAPSTTPHLNLITCNGTWDKVNKNYSQRVVVYAELKK